MKTIVIADDHQLVRSNVKALLEAEPDFRVLGEASDGLETVQLVESRKPDVLVLDLVMPRMNGIEVTQYVSEHCPETSVVIYSIYGNEAYVLGAVKAGARAYVLKETAPEELVRAIRQVSAGHHYLSPPLSEKALEAYRERVNNSTSGQCPTTT